VKHRVYMRDWYFNAGIVGFLRVISNDAMPDELSNIEGLEIGENYIEFDDGLLDGFKERFIQHTFHNFMDLNFYKRKIEVTLNKIEKNDSKLSVKKICEEEFNYKLKLGEKQSFQQRFFSDVLKKRLEDSSDLIQLKDQLISSLEILNKSNNESLYKSLIEEDAGQNYLRYFTVEQFKGIAGLGEELKNIEDSISKIEKYDYKNSLINSDICLSCQERKAVIIFNNAVSSIIGFNKDNTNWIWGLEYTKLKFCGVCTLIYYTALFGFIRQLKFYDNKSFHCYYTINRNANINILYESILLLQKTVIRDKENLKSKSFFVIIKDTLRLIFDKQIEALNDDINFIEIPINDKLSNKKNSVYTYYQYNYNIRPQIAHFINNSIIPDGYYILNSESQNSINISIDEELLNKILNDALTYSDMHRYFYYSINNKVKVHFNITQISNYIFSYINHVMSTPIRICRFSPV